MNRTLACCVAAASLALNPGAQAGLTGDTISWQYYAYGGPYLGAGSPGFFTPGVSSDAFEDASAHYFTIRGNDTQIILDEFGGVSPWSPSEVSLDEAGLFVRNGFVLGSFDAPIANVWVDPTSSMVGFDSSRVTFTAAAIAVDWAEVGFAPQSQLVLNVTLVPEPAAWVLMAAGLAGIGVMRRRQG